MSNETILITGLNLDLTDALKDSVNEKMAKLFKHNEKIVRLHIELEYQPSRKRQGEFIAKGRIELRGPDVVVSVESDDLYKSIDILEEKLTRQIRRRHRLEKEKRNHPHDIEIPSVLPKTSTV
ncbi:MAG: ribosome-associated translation inhibitor RaiA [Puniceicoccales bacterium]|jgi:putative sigma-54 modulation protein|nr:ribosome-associated translation inhibitor RaiA [Puniceicoccales bacterium]